MPINAPVPDSKAKISLCVRRPGGYLSIEIALSDLSKYNADPDGFVADYFGLSAAEYVEWIDLDGAPLCGSKTKAGKLCKVPVGRVQSGAGTWAAEHRASYCHLHT